MGELDEVLEMGRVRGSSRVAGDAWTMTKPTKLIANARYPRILVEILDQNNFRVQTRVWDDIASNMSSILAFSHQSLLKFEAIAVQELVA